MNYTVSYNPSEEEFNQVLNWSKTEYDNFYEGFYNSIKSKEDFVKNRFIIIKNCEDFPFGFITYNKDDEVLYIQEFQINIDFRKLGLGRIFIENVLEYFKNEGLLISQLFCRPFSSQKFWKKVGFIDFPDNRNVKKLTMFKPLVDFLQSQKELLDNKYKIKVWNVEEHQADNYDPNFFYSFNKLDKPIILPIDNDWRISLSKENKSIYIGAIKRASFVRDMSNYLIIDNIE